MRVKTTVLLLLYLLYNNMPFCAVVFLTLT